MITFVVEDGTGLATATSYVSLAESDDLATLNINNADPWLALPIDKKQSLLMYVSRVLDARTTWEGLPVSTTQALAWPRSGVTDKYNNSLSSSAVPLAVRWATVELAKYTMSSDLIARNIPTDPIVSEIKIDTISMRFENATNLAMAQFDTPYIVSDILKGIGTVRNSSRKIAFGKLVRV